MMYSANVCCLDKDIPRVTIARMAWRRSRAHNRVLTDAQPDIPPFLERAIGCFLGGGLVLCGAHCLPPGSHPIETRVARLHGRVVRLHGRVGRVVWLHGRVVRLHGRVGARLHGGRAGMRLHDRVIHLHGRVGVRLHGRVIQLHSRVRLHGSWGVRAVRDSVR